MFLVSTTNDKCLFSVFLKFKNVIVNDSDLFFNCIMFMPFSESDSRMTFCDVLKISRNLYSAKMLVACWPQQVVVHESDSGERGLTSRLSIVFSECQAAVGLRFLGRQLSAKTSLLIVTGLEQSEHRLQPGHSGSVRPRKKALSKYTGH